MLCKFRVALAGVVPREEGVLLVVVAEEEEGGRCRCSGSSSGRSSSGEISSSSSSGARGMTAAARYVQIKMKINGTHERVKIRQ